MIGQLPLALALRHPPRLEDFIVGGNQTAITALARSLEADGERLIFISGPTGSGRTHLLSGQCAAAEAAGLRCAYLPLREHRDLATEMLEGIEALDLIAIDDVEAIAGSSRWERALFGLFNRCREQDTRLVFSADRGPAALPIDLPDLRSRLSWGLTLALKPLDDAGRLALLKALAARRALEMPTEVGRYLLDRGPRHPKALVALIEHLDRASLAEQRPLTVPFVRDRLVSLIEVLETAPDHQTAAKKAGSPSAADG